jgi:hypothetical protein
MTKNLYFLPIIADALKHPKPKEALMAAFEEIKTLGQKSEYERGFSQFQRFMAEMKRGWERWSTKPKDIFFDEIWCLAMQMAADLLDGNQMETEAIIELIQSQPRYQDEFENLLRETPKSDKTTRTPEIMVERNGKRIDSTPCEHQPVTKEIRNVKPGLYTVKMDTGRVIWQEELTEQDLIWAAAFQGQALDLAADSEEATDRTTREILLLNGEVIIRVFSGVESGCLELKIEGSRHG